MTNYDLLKMMGFDEKLIEENKKLGMKEKKIRDMTNYMVEQAVQEKKF